MSNRAWVTLATNDSYGLGALVLAHSLRRAGSAYSTVVLVTPSITDPMRERLNAVFTEVITVDVLDSRDSAHLALLQRPELGITFTKLHCWSLTQYDKCVFLDADTLIIQKCDELFEREELSAAPDVGWPDCFNSGVFVFVPSQDTYSRLITFAQERGSFDGGDQGLLNAFFSDWAHGDINKHLPFLYNVTSAAFYSYLPAMKHYGQNLKIIHFIGAAKPWLQQYNWQSQSVDAPEHLREFLQLWWDLFVGQVHTQLDTAMEPRSTIELEDESETQPPVDISLEPPQDNLFHYAPTLNAESEFPWHHPEAQIPEAEARAHQIDMSDIYDPWQNYKGNIPPWNPGSSLNIEEPKNYVWDYLQQQETKDQSWERPSHEYEHHNITQEHTHQAHTHSVYTHPIYHGEPDSNQHHYTYHDSFQHQQHHWKHQHHINDNSFHQTHSQDHHGSHDHHSQTDSFDHTPSLNSFKEGSRVNEQVRHIHDDHSNFNHSHHSHEPKNESFLSHYQSSPGDEHHSHHERNEYHDHGHGQYPEAHIVTGDLHKHSERRSLDYHHQDHWNHSHQTQRHKTQVYRIHLDLKKQRHRERLMRIRAQAIDSTAQTNGHVNGHHESESEDDDFIPRHPYDGFYLRHIATIDSRGHKICTHEIPPTPIPSPPASPPPSSPHLNCSSPTASEEYDTASDGEDDGRKETGVAGNLARVVPGAIEYQREAIDELNRRQGWEAGNIDYMGADSFANIWAKISQTLSQTPKQPSPPRKEPTPPKDDSQSQLAAGVVASESQAPNPTEASTTSEATTEPLKESTSVPVTETPVTASEKTEPQVPPTPKSTPEGSTTPVSETAPSVEVPEPIKPSKEPASVTEEPKVEASIVAQTGPQVETKAETVRSLASVEAKVEASSQTKTKVEESVPVEGTLESSATDENKVETLMPVKETAPVEPKVAAAVPVEAKLEPSPPAEAKSEAPVPAEPKLEAAKPDEKQVEVPASVEAPKVVTEVESVAPTSPAPAAEAPTAAPVAVTTPEKALESSIATSTDSPPLANTPSKEEAPAVPSGKSEVRRKPVEKLQLSVPVVGDPLATPDSEHEDAASLAQSIIASELRATVTSPSPSADTPPVPRPPLQPQRLSVEQPEVPTPPVSLEQIGVKPKGKPTTAALIASSIKTEPQSAEPSTPTTPTTPTTTPSSSEAPKTKVVKNVVKPAPGDAPVPPPRKKEKKPKK